jgi:hypothetical protein
MENLPRINITPKAKDTIFIKCIFRNVSVVNRGKRTKFIETLFEKSKEHPRLFVSILTAVFSGAMLLFIEYGFFR